MLFFSINASAAHCFRACFRCNSTPPPPARTHSRALHSLFARLPGPFAPLLPRKTPSHHRPNWPTKGFALQRGGPSAVGLGQHGDASEQPFPSVAAAPVGWNFSRCGRHTAEDRSEPPAPLIVRAVSRAEASPRSPLDGRSRAARFGGLPIGTEIARSSDTDKDEHCARSSTTFSGGLLPFGGLDVCSELRQVKVDR